MKILIQRVSQAHVDIDSKTVASIQQGLLIFCGFDSQDTPQTLINGLNKCISYRIFEDDMGKMNRSLKDVEGSLLLVPQFTLLADTASGLRPGFSKGASQTFGQSLFSQLINIAKEQGIHVQHGIFGANMKVHLCNDGPATFILNF